MSFFVDVVSEDSFYENLTLGATKLLEANPCVKNVQLERRGACDRLALSSWEQKHCCLLTEDLRNFYTSTDGFLLTWSLEIAGEEFPIGRMEIKDLASLKRHTGMPISKEQQQQQQQQHAESSSGSGGDSSAEASSSSGSIASGSSNQSESHKRSCPPLVEPSFFGGSRCKLFELAECGQDCRVLLAYQLQPDQDEPSVWLYRGGGDSSVTTGRRWYRLADSFCRYFRMMLVHLGLPQWQICAAGLQLPTWLEQVYLLVGPHLLPEVAPASQSDTTETSLWNDGPTNLLDPAIFRGKESAGPVAARNATTAAAATSSSGCGSNPTKTSSKTSSQTTTTPAGKKKASATAAATASTSH
ncbi:hypothetical protein TKK_0017985 [Trichogramma kaykai]